MTHMRVRSGRSRQEERPCDRWAMSKTTYKRSDRVADQIRMEVADILMRKIKDPRVRSVTVTDVELTADLRIAYIFVTTMEKEQAERDVFAGLSKASGFVRAELGRRLALRYLPEIVFKRDETGPRGDRVMKLLDELQPHETAQDASDDTSGPAELIIPPMRTK